MLRLAWIRLVAAAVAASLLHPLPAIAKSLRPDPVPDAWQRPHADGANTGYANVATAPAGKAARTVPNLGSFAPGAGPVIGADGTVYVGNMQGKLMAFRPDGSPAWSRQLDAGQQILASPVIGSDGGIYVVSQSMFTDTRVNPPFTRPDSTLHKFLPGGGYAWQVQFPENGSKLPVPNGRGGTSAAPNIWRFGGEEAVIVPVVYPNRLTSGREVRLIAFSTTGPSVIGDAPVSTFVPQVTGSGPGCKDKVFCLFPIPGFQGGALPNQGGALPNDQDLGAHLPSDIRLPMPPVAIYTFPGGGTPWIVVSDNLWDVVGFSFSPQQGFFEGFRAHDENWKLTGTPMVMPNTETFVMKVGGVLDWRGGAIKYRSVIEAYAAAGPSRTAEDKILFLASRAIGERQGNAIVNEQPLPGQTMVAPAVSQNNVFVSTANAFVTFDSSTLQQVAKLDWRGGGTSPPAIGPYGDVYAIAGSTLHVFAAPVCGYCASQPTFPVAGAPPLAPVQPAAPTTPTAGQSRFENPQGPNGLRLHACTEVGGDDCGKPVAKAFCQAQGWAKVDKYDTKSKKVQAETLAGETCNKNKCKVFDFISCEN
jgi:hypothetical protein